LTDPKPIANGRSCVALIRRSDWIKIGNGA
jgi:hypothetical protein